MQEGEIIDPSTVAVVKCIRRRMDITGSKIAYQQRKE